MALDESGAAEASRVLSNMYDAAKAEGDGWEEVAAELDNVVSTAMLWKVAHGKAKSAKVAQKLGIPTQPKCKANGWYRRAAWVHEDDLDAFNKWLSDNGCETLQEYVNSCIERQRVV